MPITARGGSGPGFGSVGGLTAGAGRVGAEGSAIGDRDFGNAQRLRGPPRHDARRQGRVGKGQNLGGQEACVGGASRTDRPVYLTTNPFAGHTFRRLNDGDRPLADEEVKRMFAEQVEDSRDDRILRGYGLDDLCMETFRAYRPDLFHHRRRTARPQAKPRAEQKSRRGKRRTFSALA